MVTVTTAGCTSGNIISQKHRIGPQPSIAAASSKVVDMLLKNVMRKNVVYGTEHAVYKKIKVNREPDIFSLLTTENKGITIMMFGIAKPMIINFSNTWFSLNFTRDMQYAAGAQTNMIKIHDGTVYITEFPRFSNALFFVNALM